MALFYMDGFDLGDYADRWDFSTTATRAVTAGRGTGQALRLTGGSGAFTSKRFLPGAGAARRWTIGFAYRVGNVSAQGNIKIVEFVDAIGNTAFYLRYLSDGTWQIFAAGPGQTYTTTTAQVVLTLNTWFYIEISVISQNSVQAAGTIILRVNGVTLLDPSTFLANSSNLEQVRLHAGGNGSAADYDDLYIHNDGDSNPTVPSAVPPTFYGDSVIRTLVPDGNGTYTNLNGSDGNQVNNFQLVDEATRDDADFVSSDVVGNKDTYQFANLPQNNGTVTGVQVVAVARATDPAGKKMRFAGRSNTQDFFSPAKTLTTTFSPVSHLFTNNPVTGLPWTDTEINTGEFGVEVS